MVNPELQCLGYFPNDGPAGKGVYYSVKGLSIVVDVDGDGEIILARGLRFPPVGAEIDTVDKQPAIQKAGEMVLKILEMLGVSAVILKPEISEEPSEDNTSNEGVIE